MTISKIKRDCPHCGKSRDWKENTGYTTQLLSGTIHGYVAWQETDDKTGKETFYCRPHGATSLLSPSRFDSMKNLGEYIGNNKLKTY